MASSETEITYRALPAPCPPKEELQVDLTHGVAVLFGVNRSFFS